MLALVATATFAQHDDDLYYIPKKKAAQTQTEKVEKQTPVRPTRVADTGKTVSVTAVATRDDETDYSDASELDITAPLNMDDDAYNRRGNTRSYIDEDGNYVQEADVDGLALRVKTTEGDTLYYRVDSLIVEQEDDGWVNGFNGDAEDYEYAMRLIRFRSPRYAIPVSSPLYWDIVYGGGLWPTWDWNVYDDGLYAYVFPSSYNWNYWGWRYYSPYTWGGWPYGCYGGWGGWGYHHYGWYDPWYDPWYTGMAWGWGPGWYGGYYG